MCKGQDTNLMSIDSFQIISFSVKRIYLVENKLTINLILVVSYNEDTPFIISSNSNWVTQDVIILWQSNYSLFIYLYVWKIRRTKTCWWLKYQDIGVSEHVTRCVYVCFVRNDGNIDWVLLTVLSAEWARPDQGQVLGTALHSNWSLCPSVQLYWSLLVWAGGRVVTIEPLLTPPHTN